MIWANDVLYLDIMTTKDNQLYLVLIAVRWKSNPLSTKDVCIAR